MSIDISAVELSRIPLSRQYLLLVAISIFENMNGGEYSLDELNRIDHGYDTWGVLNKTNSESDPVLISHAIIEFRNLGYIREIESDGYSPNYIEIVIPTGVVESVVESKIWSKKGLLNGEWLGTALDNVAKELGALIEDVEDLESVASDDLWEPLKIERSSEALETELGFLDAELSKIEGDNGYAGSEPDERNAIVIPARGVWQALKDGGIPSEGVIKNTLVKPFRYLAKKFADATIGIAAKNIVALVLKFLSGA